MFLFWHFSVLYFETQQKLSQSTQLLIIHTTLQWRRGAERERKKRDRERKSEEKKEEVRGGETLELFGEEKEGAWEGFSI